MSTIPTSQRGRQEDQESYKIKYTNKKKKNHYVLEIIKEKYPENGGN